MEAAFSQAQEAILDLDKSVSAIIEESTQFSSQPCPIYEATGVCPAGNNCLMLHQAASVRREVGLDGRESGPELDRPSPLKTRVLAKLFIIPTNISLSWRNYASVFGEQQILDHIQKHTYTDMVKRTVTHILRGETTDDELKTINSRKFAATSGYIMALAACDLDVVNT